MSNNKNLYTEWNDTSPIKWDDTLPIGYDFKKNMILFGQAKNDLINGKNNLIPYNQLSDDQLKSFITAFINTTKQINQWEDFYCDDQLITFDTAYKEINSLTELGKALIDMFLLVNQQVINYLVPISENSIPKNSNNVSRDFKKKYALKPQENIDPAQKFDISILSAYPSEIALWAYDTNGNPILFGNLVNGQTSTIHSFFGQEFVATAVNTGGIIGRYIAYPGRKAWKIYPIINEILTPSLSERVKKGNITVKNEYPTYLELYWVDPECRPINMEVLPPHETMTFEAYEADHWLVMQGDKIIENYTIGSTLEDVNPTWTVTPINHPNGGAWLSSDMQGLDINTIDAYSIGDSDFSIGGMVKLGQYAQSIVSFADHQPFSYNGQQYNYKFYELRYYEHQIIFSVMFDSLSDSTSQTRTKIFEINVPYNLNDGACHHLCFTKQNDTYKLYVNGKLEDTLIFSNPLPPFLKPNLNIVGQTPPGDRMVMHWGFWKKALSEKEVLLASCMLIDKLQNDLLGYWPLKDSFKDISSYHNDIVPYEHGGKIIFKPCFSCIQLYGDENFVFCQIGNPQNDTVEPEPVAITQNIEVPALPAGATEQYLYVGICEDASWIYQFPQGLQLEIIDPNSINYAQKADTNTQDVYLKKEGNSIYILAIKNPVPGQWKVKISGQTNTSFEFYFQTVPLGSIKDTFQNTLNEIFPNWVTTAVKGISLVSAVALPNTTSTSLIGPFVILAILIIIFLVVVVASIIFSRIHKEATIEFNKASLLKGTEGALYADVNGDPITEAFYNYRSMTGDIYGTAQRRVEKDRFEEIFGDGQHDQIPFTKENFAKYLLSIEGLPPRYVSVGSHGDKDMLCSRMKTSTPGYRVLMDKNDSNLADLAKNKIFYFLACKTGMEDGLGKTLVAKGATAFIGYDDYFTIKDNYDPTIVANELEPACVIDIELLKGATVKEAINSAKNKFKELGAKGTMYEKIIDALINLNNGDKLIYYGNKDAKFKADTDQFIHGQQ